MKVLVFNCGSSSVKYKLFDMPAGTVVARGAVERIGNGNSCAFQEAAGTSLELQQPVESHKAALALITSMLTAPEKGAIDALTEIDACGHRVVHGGETFTGSVVVTDNLEAVIERYSALAPLHNPPNLAGIKAAKTMFGSIPQIACFDTAFHQTIPEIAYLYALPYELYEKLGIRKYGFHGTSHKWVSRRAAALLGKTEHEVNLITCHLGNGCSMAAIRAGTVVDTSMGMTPLEGLVMGTRTGDIDPAVIFYLIRNGYSSDELDRIFNKQSGLLGISGCSNDLRDLEQQTGSRRARLALEMFAYRIRKYIGAYLCILNGCDGIVFTGGIGENGATMRRRILDDMDFMGIHLDCQRNLQTVGGKTGEIGADCSKIRVLVVPTDEETAIALDTYTIVSTQP